MKNYDLNKEHIQNMKDELYMMKYGYWIKTKDRLEDLDREYEFQKFKLIQRDQQFKFKYISKSKYPEIILQKIDGPINFNNDNIKMNALGGNQISIRDKNNYILYTYTKYIIDYSPISNHNSGLYSISKDKLSRCDLIDKQLEIKIKSLESMIYMFENM